MYHIVFSADEKYIKYTAVLISSIVFNTGLKRKNEKYYFHILSDFVGEHTQAKLLRLQNELSLIFPCEINLHLQKDKDYEKFPFCGAAHSSKIPYYRLKMASIFDENVQKCLYLDSDMLCMCDIREVFAYDLEDKIVAVVGDLGSKKAKIKYKENNKKITFNFDENYFNSGFLLINLKEYKKQNIEQKCENLATKTYYIKAADQDLLNATIKAKYQLKLDFAYNFSTMAFCYVICKDEKKKRLNYTRAEFNHSAKNPKILHYGEKPWRFLKSYFNYGGGGLKKEKKNINDYWWDIAFKTPVFNEELVEDRKSIQDHLLFAGLGYELLKASLKLNLLKIRSLIKHTAKDSKYMQKAKNIQDDIFGLCCILGVVILHARAKRKNFFSAYLKALKNIYYFKKYAHK